MVSVQTKHILRIFRKSYSLMVLLSYLEFNLLMHSVSFGQYEFSTSVWYSWSVGLTGLRSCAFKKKKKVFLKEIYLFPCCVSIARIRPLRPLHFTAF